jgi:hypothetical protein
MAAVAVEWKSSAGGVAAGLVTAVCCGGLPLFASIGLGTFFAGLGLWRYLPAIIILGTVLIVAVNWVAYARKARRGHRLRAAMLVSGAIGLAVLVVGFFVLEWLERGPLHELTEPFVEGSGAENPAAVAQARWFALGSFPVGLLVLAALPMPARSRARPAVHSTG